MVHACLLSFILYSPLPILSLSTMNRGELLKQIVLFYVFSHSIPLQLSTKMHSLSFLSSSLRPYSGIVSLNEADLNALLYMK